MAPGADRKEGLRGRPWGRGASPLLQEGHSALPLTASQTHHEAAQMRGRPDSPSGWAGALEVRGSGRPQRQLPRSGGEWGGGCGVRVSGWAAPHELPVHPCDYCLSAQRGPWTVGPSALLTEGSPRSTGAAS